MIQFYLNLKNYLFFFTKWDMKGYSMYLEYGGYWLSHEIINEGELISILNQIAGDDIVFSPNVVVPGGEGRYSIPDGEQEYIDDNFFSGDSDDDWFHTDDEDEGGDAESGGEAENGGDESSGGEAESGGDESSGGGEAESGGGDEDYGQPVSNGDTVNENTDPGAVEG